jgi:hypothetical protein
MLFTGALDDEGIWARIEAHQAGCPLDGDDPEVPILLAMSDNGPEMRAGSGPGGAGLHRWGPEPVVGRRHRARPGAN